MPRRPNVLFLLSDEHCFRHLSALPVESGGEPVRTPTLDGLIATGAWLRRAYCQMPLCTPSRMCLMAGREVEEIGAWNNSSVLHPRYPTLGSTFTSAGWATCLNGKLHFGGRRQYAGFADRRYGDFGGPCSHQDDPLPGNPQVGGLRGRTADSGLSQVPESLLQEQFVVRESVAWLRELAAAQPEAPWLLNASFSRPHFPLTAPRRFLNRYLGTVPPPKVGRSGDSANHPMTVGMAAGFQVDAIDVAERQRARAAYFACVDLLDEVLGDFLALLDRDGLLDETIIVYTSDHGELCGEHGLWWKNSWHEAATRVPFLISLPEHRRGELPPVVVDEPVSLADLFPTLCGLCGIEPPEELAGTDLSSAVRGGGLPARRRPVTCQALTPRWGAGTEFRLVVEGSRKYIAFRDAPDLLFDVVADPFEQRDLAGTAGDAAALRETTLAGFDFAAAEARRRREEPALKADYALPARPRTSNQIVLGDGRLVEVDQVLLEPEVLSRSPREEFGA